MSTEKTILLGRIEENTKAIRKAGNAWNGLAKRCLKLALEAGPAVKALKADLKSVKKRWLPFVAEHLPVSDRTLSRWVFVSDGIETLNKWCAENSVAVTDLTIDKAVEIIHEVEGKAPPRGPQAGATNAEAETLDSAEKAALNQQQAELREDTVLSRAVAIRNAMQALVSMIHDFALPSDHAEPTLPGVLDQVIALAQEAKGGLGEQTTAA